MPAINVAKAVRSNPIYAKHTRWIERFADVLDALGFSHTPKTAVEFAESVAQWQATNKLKTDGMLGPKTWKKMRTGLPKSSKKVAMPSWLRSVDDEGWTEAVVATLRSDTSFLRLKTRTHNINPADFRHIADLITNGTIDVVAVDGTGSYDFRNEGVTDPNSLKVPRRAKFGWRRAQALIVHEACHAISDSRGKPMEFLTEEATAYVVQLMFLERFNTKMPTDARRRELYEAAQVLARRYLKGGKETPKDDDSDWRRLKDVIRRHPEYVQRLAKFPELNFDGFE